MIPVAVLYVYTNVAVAPWPYRTVRYCEPAAAMPSMRVGASKKSHRIIIGHHFSVSSAIKSHRVPSPLTEEWRTCLGHWPLSVAWGWPAGLEAGAGARARAPGVHGDGKCHLVAAR
jgi:hypothetical protein